MDVSIVNSFILERKVPNHRSRAQLEFRAELVKDLIGNFTSRARTASSGQLEVGHRPIPFAKGRCIHCLMQKKTTFCRMGCQCCNKRICLECFAKHIGDLSECVTRAWNSNYWTFSISLFYSNNQDSRHCWHLLWRLLCCNFCNVKWKQ